MLRSSKNVHSPLYTCICLKNKEKINVIILSQEDLGDTIINLAQMGFYAS